MTCDIIGISGSMASRPVQTSPFGISQGGIFFRKQELVLYTFLFDPEAP